jgi:hypothetical protein
LTQTMYHMNFKSCLADPDVWMGPAIQAYGKKYYQYVLIYVDDILAVSATPKAM